MKKKWIWWGIYIIAVILLAVIIYVVPSLMGLLDTTYTIESGTVQVKDSPGRHGIQRKGRCIHGCIGEGRRPGEG